ncbi:hypothetical protein D3C84_842350 [compost metagenome]
MAANVAKRLHLLVVVTHEDDRGLADVYGRNIPRLRDVRRHADQNPVPGEKDIDVAVENVLTPEQRAMHAMAWGACSHQFLLGFRDGSCHLLPHGGDVESSVSDGEASIKMVRICVNAL